jgi:C4-dicarboxylate transporter DctQ subunit
MDLLPRILSPKNRRRLALVIGVTVLIFLAVFFYFSAEHTLRVAAAKQLTPIMLAPMWLTYLAMPVGSVLMFVRTCQILCRAALEDPAATAKPALDLQD